MMTTSASPTTTKTNSEEDWARTLWSLAAAHLAAEDKRYEDAFDGYRILERKGRNGFVLEVRSEALRELAPPVIRSSVRSAAEKLGGYSAELEDKWWPTFELRAPVASVEPIRKTAPPEEPVESRVSFPAPAGSNGAAKRVWVGGPDPERFKAIGVEIGGLVAEKNRAYGNAFSTAGKAMRLLYPAGIAPDQFDDALCLVRIWDKMMRIATDRDALGESPYRDIAGYGILGAERAERGRGED